MQIFGKYDFKISDNQKRWWTIAHKNQQIGGLSTLGSFDLENGTF